MGVAIVAVPVLAIVVVLVLATGGGGGGQTLRGKFVLTDSDNVTGDWESCGGTGGYDDFGAGMDVTVRNGSGDIIASANTESAGDFVGNHDDAKELRDELEGYDDLGWCPVLWEVEVPDDERFYEVEIGRRGELSFSKSELEDHEWEVEATLG